MKITLDKYDKIWEAISILSLLTIAVLIAFTLSTLPDTIPIHFNFQGKADGFGSKYTLWLLFGIAVLMYATFTFISFRPELYKSRMTENNLEEQYKLTAKMTRTTKMYILLFFVILTLFILQAAQGKWTEQIPFLILIFFALILPPTFYYLIKLSKVR
jgi:uncharacterized membrane protein